MTGYILLGVVVVLLLGAVTIYNKLVTNKNLVAEGWSGIDVQLKRRNDLIPNLIETVKGYMGHERGVLDQVTELRTKSQAAQGVADKAKVEGAMGAALANLFAVAENYPDLKAMPEFYGAAKIPGRHRGPGPAGPALLQRGRPELQHPDPVFSQQPDGLRLPLHHGGILRNRGRRRTGRAQGCLSLNRSERKRDYFPLTRCNHHLA